MLTNSVGNKEIGDDRELQPFRWLIREVREEYWVEISTYTHLWNRNLEKNWISWSFYEYICFVNWEPKIMEPAKMQDISWFDINSLPEPIHSEIPWIIKKYNLL